MRNIRDLPSPSEFLFVFSFYFLCANALPSYMYVRGSQKGIGSPLKGVTDNCELSGGYCDLNLDHLWNNKCF